MHNPDAAKVINGRDGHSPLFLAFQHHADDKTILGLMNHAPDVSNSKFRDFQMIFSSLKLDFVDFLISLANCCDRQEDWDVAHRNGN
jgi:hypothetical protein